MAGCCSEHNQSGPVHALGYNTAPSVRLFARALSVCESACEATCQRGAPWKSPAISAERSSTKSKLFGATAEAARGAVAPSHMPASGAAPPAAGGGGVVAGCVGCAAEPAAALGAPVPPVPLAPGAMPAGGVACGESLGFDGAVGGCIAAVAAVPAAPVFAIVGGVTGSVDVGALVPCVCAVSESPPNGG